MFPNKLRFQASISLALFAVLLVPGGNIASAQNAQEAAQSGHFLDGMKISGDRTTNTNIGPAPDVSPHVHVTGMNMTVEMRSKDGVLQRFHADDIQVVRTGKDSAGDLSGNLRYALLQSPGSSTLLEGTAEHALYKMSSDDNNRIVTLTKAHLSLLQNSKEVVVLGAAQVVVNPQNGTLTATGATRFTLDVKGRHIEITANQIIWNLRANTIEASGKVHMTFKDPQVGNGTVDNDGVMRLELKDLAENPK